MDLINLESKHGFAGYSIGAGRPATGMLGLREQRLLRKPKRSAHFRARRRLGVLNDLHNKLLQVIDERAKSEDMVAVPGGKTGIVTKTLKGIGKGEDFKMVEEYRVDTASVAEIRDIQKQAAEELGQWIKRTESLDLNQLFERMSDSEIEAVINQGTLPEWFEAAVQGYR